MQDLPFHRQALHAAYAAGTAPAEVVAEAMRRIAEADDPGIFIALRPAAEAIAEAAALGPFDPQRLPLFGLPFAIKDNIDLTGLPTTAGCPAFAYTPGRDAFVVARLRQAGAIAVGKCNLDQFATGLVGTRTPYPVPRNAVDPTLVPGGSSSGSAVAVARGLVSFALGSDTAGSGRVPAALNNIVGLKPSLGLLSCSGVVPACRTLDAVSIFAATVADAWAVLDTAAAFDPADPYARRFRRASLAPLPPLLRVGVPDAAGRRFFGDALQAAAFDAALRLIERLGGRLIECDFRPFFDVAAMLYEGAWLAERLTVVEDLLGRDPPTLHPVTRSVIEPAAKLRASDAFRGFYRLAERRRHAERQLAEIDLLCVPSIPTPCRLSELDADPIGPNGRLGTYTNFVNLLDLCGIAVPTPRRADGLPASVTLLAAAGGDARVAALAAALHQASGVAIGATGWPLPAAETLPPAVDHDEIAIAVCGAHMAGLPLNHELTERGGRFLEATATAAAYRLVLLDGPPPRRPGLLRHQPGASIALELWALPRSAVGDLLARIPPPLGLGTIELADGRSVNGMLCEAAAVQAALDISAHRSWRAFLAGQADR